MVRVDRRTLGELLAEADQLARDTLAEVRPHDAPNMVRAWPGLVTAAVRAWTALPAAAPRPGAMIPRPDVGPFARLVLIAEGLRNGQAARGWPGPGPGEERLTLITANFDRAAWLLQRRGQHLVATSAVMRMDLAAAQMRILHTLYVGAHGVGLALDGYGRHLDRVPKRQRDAPHSKAVAATRAFRTRMDVFEQVAGEYVTSRGGPAVMAGEQRTIVRPARLPAALAAWDLQARRTLAEEPRAANVATVAWTQAMITATAMQLVDAAGRTGAIDPDTAARLVPRLGAAQQEWCHLRERWQELVDPGQRTQPLLIGLASEVRAAVVRPAQDASGWASADTLADRLNLTRVCRHLQPAITGGVDLAQVALDIAVREPALTGPARMMALRAQMEIEHRQDHGDNRWVGAEFVTPDDLRANRTVPIPEPPPGSTSCTR